MLKVEVNHFIACFGHSCIKIILKINRKLSERRTNEKNKRFGHNTIIGSRPLGGGDPLVVKLLGVTIDFRLIFDIHISNICKNASRQLNVLKRIGKHL